MGGNEQCSDRARRPRVGFVLAAAAVLVPLVVVGRAEAAFDAPDEPRPIVCPNTGGQGGDPPPENCVSWFDSWLGDLTVDPIVGLGDTMTLAWDPFYGLRPPTGATDPRQSAPAWGQMRNLVFFEPIDCADWNPTCTLRVVQGNFAPKPADDGTTDPVEWSRANVPLANGIGGASEQRPYYVKPSVFWGQFRLFDTDGTALQIGSGLTMYFQRREREGIVYQGDTFADLARRYDIYQFSPVGKFAEFQALNPQYAAAIVTDELAPGAVTIPAGDVRSETGNALNNVITMSLWQGTYDIAIRDNGGRYYEPFSVDVTNDNVFRDVVAGPDPLVVSNVVVDSQIDPLASFTVSLDVTNVSGSVVRQVTPTIRPTVLPAGGAGIRRTDTTPGSIDIDPGQTEPFVVTLDPLQGGRARLDTTASGSIGLADAPLSEVRVTSSPPVQREVRLGSSDLVASFRLRSLDSDLGDVDSYIGPDGPVAAIEVLPGDVVDAELTVFNAGDNELTDVGPGSIDPDAGVLVQSGPSPSGPVTLAPGTGTQFDYELVAQSGGTFMIAGPASGEGPGGTVSDTARAEIAAAGMRLEVVEAPTDIGESQSETITVKVLSDDTALTDIAVTAPTAVDGDGRIDSPDSYNGLSLPPNDSIDLTFNVFRTQPGDLTWEIVATAFGDEEYIDEFGDPIDAQFDEITARVRGDLGGGLLEITSLTVEPDELEVGETFELVAEVSNAGATLVENIRLDVVETPDDLVRTDGDAEPLALAPGTSGVVRVAFAAEATGEVTLEATASGDSESGTAESDPVPVTATIGAPALEIVLRGIESDEPNSFEVVAEVTNLLDEPIENLVWTGGGLEIDEIDDADVITMTSGPSPLLPTELAAAQTAEYRWGFDIDDLGTAVTTLQGIGATAGGAPAKGNGALSIEIGAPTLEDDEWLEIVVDGLTDALGNFDELLRLFGEETSVEVAQSLNDEFLQTKYDAYRAMGMSDWSARQHASADLEVEGLKAYWRSYASGFQASIDARGAQGGQAIYDFVDTVSDPLKRRQAAERMVRGGVENLGYLGDAVTLPLGVGGTLSANAQMIDRTGTAVGEAWVGQRELWRIEGESADVDLVGTMAAAGGRQGGLEGNAAFDFMVGVAAAPAEVVVEAAAVATLTRVANGTRHGLSSMRSAHRAAERSEAAGDVSGAAANRYATAELEIDSFQSRSYNEVLDADGIRAAGYSPEDAATIQGIVRETEDLIFTLTGQRVPMRIVGRTATPGTLDVPGAVGKQEWMGYKAVSQLDHMLGAPTSVGGRASVFEPQPLPTDVLRTIEARSPGFTRNYVERLQTQRDNFADWNSGTGRMNRLVEASENARRVAQETGDPALANITIVSARPGRPTFGVDYLEQLDDPAFVTSRGLTPEQIAQVRAHPSRVKANVVADTTDGVTTFSIRDGDALNPIGSDYDLQGVEPVSGVWPPGTRGQVETFVMQRFNRELPRSGRHGWSDSGFDLPSDYYKKLVEYQMRTANPDRAAALAERSAGNFERLAQQADRQADALELRIAQGDPNSSLLAIQVQKLRDKAANFRRNTAESLLAEFPSGEKTIVFTAGDVRVGSGTAPGTGP